MVQITESKIVERILMKPIINLLLLFTLFHFTTVFAGGPLKVNQLEDALAESNKTHQKIVAVFGAKWCDHCMRLHKDLENNLDVIDSYIYVYIDVEKREDLKNSYNIKNIPDILIIANNIPIKRKSGYANIKEFQKWLNK
jgi:thioredoxin-like negative regulator of GroEL